MKHELKDLFYLHKSVARSVANWVRMVGTVGTLHGYGTQYLTYVPKCRTYVPMYRTMRTLFTVPVLLSKPYLKKVANRALLLKIDNSNPSFFKRHLAAICSLAQRKRTFNGFDQGTCQSDNTRQTVTSTQSARLQSVTQHGRAYPLRGPWSLPWSGGAQLGITSSIRSIQCTFVHVSSCFFSLFFHCDILVLGPFRHH